MRFKGGLPPGPGVRAGSSVRAHAEQLVERDVDGRMDLFGIEPGEALHHHAGVYLEHLPVAIRVHDIDRGEADADRLRGRDSEPNAGVSPVAAVQQLRTRAEFEIMLPAQQALSSLWHDPIEIAHAELTEEHRVLFRRGCA